MPKNLLILSYSDSKLTVHFVQQDSQVNLSLNLIQSFHDVNVIMIFFHLYSRLMTYVLDTNLLLSGHDFLEAGNEN
jgi:hypothetical protein